MGQIASEADTVIYAWALMTNHANILLRSGLCGPSIPIQPLKQYPHCSHMKVAQQSIITYHSIVIVVSSQLGHQRLHQVLESFMTLSPDPCGKIAERRTQFGTTCPLLYPRSPFLIMAPIKLKAKEGKTTLQSGVKSTETVYSGLIRSNF